MAKEIYYFREGLVASIVSDTYTFALVLGSIWFNYAFCGGSYFLNGVLLVIFLLMLVAKAEAKRTTFHSREALIKHLKREDAQ